MKPARGEDVQVDAEFAEMIPPLAADELAQLAASIQHDGCRDPLLVWKGTRLLLDGHNRFRICNEHDISFRVIELEFADRDAAREFILRNQLMRRNLSVEAVSYLRGQRYLALKHQGARDTTSGQNGQKTTAELLAEEYKVGEKTIRRDAKFAEAIDEIAGNCGEESKKFILSRDAGLTRGAVARLLKMSPREQRHYIHELMKTGKRPRRIQGPRGRFVRLPTERGAMVTALLDHLGPENAADLVERLHKALEAGHKAR